MIWTLTADKVLAKLLDADQSLHQMLKKCKECVRQEVLVEVTTAIRAASA